ncbi:unnamed protein product [Amoebophrya sp. A120]|nr:unnamed protein product [Amoebophrya sp. A120]|eukprot:GSA120T00013238001.1
MFVPGRRIAPNTKQEAQILLQFQKTLLNASCPAMNNIGKEISRKKKEFVLALHELDYDEGRKMEFVQKEKEEEERKLLNSKNLVSSVATSSCASPGAGGEEPPPVKTKTSSSSNENNSPSSTKSSFPETYLIMIKVNKDETLLRLAKEQQFPRGCPFLFFPKENRVLSFGFYPKFGHDYNVEKDRKSGKNRIKPVVQKSNEFAEFFEEALKQKTVDSDDENLRLLVDPRVKQNKEEEKKIRMFCLKKYSGFLSILIAWEWKKEFFYTVTSKNSADFFVDTKLQQQFINGFDNNTNFVKIGLEQWRNYMSDARCKNSWVKREQLFIQHLAKQNLCCTAEVMSKQDETHGTKVKQDDMVITGVFEGAKDHEKEKHRLSTPKSVLDMVKFCNEWNLPCQKVVGIGESLNEINRFYNKLWEKKDFMTDEKFEEFLEKEAKATLGFYEKFILGMMNINSGSCNSNLKTTSGAGAQQNNKQASSSSSSSRVNPNDGKNPDQQNKVQLDKHCFVHHKDILGDCLEGVIIIVQTTTGDIKSMRKLKFPNYMCRIQLREWMKNLKQTANFALQKGKNSPNMITSCIANKISTFTMKWCATEMGRKYWRAWLYRACVLHYENSISSIVSSGNSLVKNHIALAEATEHQCQKEREGKEKEREEKEKENKQNLLDVPSSTLSGDKNKSSTNKVTTVVVPAPNTALETKFRAIFEQKLRDPKLSKLLILVVGPVGYGKSSFARQMVEKLNNNIFNNQRSCTSSSADQNSKDDQNYCTTASTLIHIDGDDLGLVNHNVKAGAPSSSARTSSDDNGAPATANYAAGIKSTSGSASSGGLSLSKIANRLKHERQELTFFRLVQAMTEKKVPVLSCGGGVLYDTGSSNGNAGLNAPTAGGQTGSVSTFEMRLRNWFRSVLPQFELKIVTFLPGGYYSERVLQPKGPKSGSTSVHQEVVNNNAWEIMQKGFVKDYANSKTVQETVRSRLARGEWELEDKHDEDLHEESEEEALPGVSVDSSKDERMMRTNNSEKNDQQQGAQPVRVKSYDKISTSASHRTERDRDNAARDHRDKNYARDNARDHHRDRNAREGRDRDRDHTSRDRSPRRNYTRFAMENDEREKPGTKSVISFSKALEQEFVSKIVKLSSKNVRFAKKLMLDSDFVYHYPRIEWNEKKNKLSPIDWDVCLKDVYGECQPVVVGNKRTTSSKEKENKEDGTKNKNESKEKENNKGDTAKFEDTTVPKLYNGVKEFELNHLARIFNTGAASRGRTTSTLQQQGKDLHSKTGATTSSHAGAAAAASTATASSSSSNKITTTENTNSTTLYRFHQIRCLAYVAPQCAAAGKKIKSKPENLEHEKKTPVDHHDKFNSNTYRDEHFDVLQQFGHITLHFGDFYLNEKLIEKFFKPFESCGNFNLGSSMMPTATSSSGAGEIVSNKTNNQGCLKLHGLYCRFPKQMNLSFVAVFFQDKEQRDTSMTNAKGLAENGMTNSRLFGHITVDVGKYSPKHVAKLSEAMFGEDKVAGRSVVTIDGEEYDVKDMLSSNVIVNIYTLFCVASNRKPSCAHSGIEAPGKTKIVAGLPGSVEEKIQHLLEFLGMNKKNLICAKSDKDDKDNVEETAAAGAPASSSSHAQVSVDNKVDNESVPKVEQETVEINKEKVEPPASRDGENKTEEKDHNTSSSPQQQNSGKKADNTSSSPEQNSGKNKAKLHDQSLHDKNLLVQSPLASEKQNHVDHHLANRKAEPPAYDESVLDFGEDDDLDMNEFISSNLDHSAPVSGKVAEKEKGLEVEKHQKPRRHSDSIDSDMISSKIPLVSSSKNHNQKKDQDDRDDDILSSSPSLSRNNRGKLSPPNLSSDSELSRQIRKRRKIVEK